MHPDLHPIHLDILIGRECVHGLLWWSCVFLPLDFVIFPYPFVSLFPLSVTSWLAVPVLHTLVEVFGRLARVATAIGATFLLSRALSVMITALHAGGSKAAGPLWRWAGALLHRQHRLEELAAGHTLPVLVGKHLLNELEGDKLPCLLSLGITSRFIYIPVLYDTTLEWGGRFFVVCSLYCLSLLFTICTNMYNTQICNIYVFIVIERCTRQVFANNLVTN